MYATSAATLLSLIPFTLATNYPVTVGAAAKLAFNPPKVTANIGDTITFSYFPKNHSVTQSSFAEPCQPLANGFNSGFQPLSAGPGPVDFVVTVKDTKPIWIYCAQTVGSHCQSGMSMVVNEPAPPSPNTLEAYQLAAAKTNVSIASPHIGGGVFVPHNSSSGTGTGTATASAPSSTGTSTGYGNGYTGSSGGYGSSGYNGSSSGSSSSSSGSSSNSSNRAPNTGSTTEIDPIPYSGAASNVRSGRAFALAGALLLVVALL